MKTLKEALSVSEALFSRRNLKSTKEYKVKGLSSDIVFKAVKGNLEIKYKNYNILFDYNWTQKVKYSFVEDSLFVIPDESDKFVFIYHHLSKTIELVKRPDIIIFEISLEESTLKELVEFLRTNF